ncbi:MAG TPA: hypothetical protein VMI54_13340 [Polyangiaceae bacterium]|nr:hypothetical protein [Polyangiaceae bacterium]
MQRSFDIVLAAFAVTVAAFATAGCAAAPPAFSLRAADFGKVPIPPGRPLVLAFKAGERVPVVLDVSGELVDIDPRPTRVWLTAKRDFFVRIDGSKVTTSLDGVHFDRRPAKPGTFRFGLASDPANGAHIEVAIVTPVHAR